MSALARAPRRSAGAVLVGAAACGAVALATIAGAALPVLAGATAAAVVPWIWARPQRGVLLLAALLPFDGLLLVVDLPAAAVAWKEVLLAVTLVAAFAAPGPPVAGRRVPGWALPLVALATLALLSAVFVPVVQAGVGLKVTFTGALTALAVWRRPFTARDRDHLVTVLAVAGAVVAAVGVAQQFLGPERLNELGYAYNSTIRFTGRTMRSWSTFNQPFPFAFFLMLVVLVTGSVALADPWRTRNLLVLAAMPLLLAGIVLAVVRAAWIGLAVGVVYLAVTRYRRLLALAPAALGVLALALVLGAAGFFTPASLDARVDRWQVVPALTVEAPFGQGIGSAGAAAARAEALTGGAATFDPTRTDATRVVFQPDNAYVKVLYELGILGLGLFVALLLAVFAAARLAARDPSRAAFATGTAAFVLAAAVASTAATFFEIFPLDYLFWLVVAVATVSPGPRTPPAPTRSSP